MTREEIRAAGAKAAEGAPPLNPQQRALIRAAFSQARRSQEMAR